MSSQLIFWNFVYANDILFQAAYANTQAAVTYAGASVNVVGGGEGRDGALLLIRQ